MSNLTLDEEFVHDLFSKTLFEMKFYREFSLFCVEEMLVLINDPVLARWIAMARLYVDEPLLNAAIRPKLHGMVISYSIDNLYYAVASAIWCILEEEPTRFVAAQCFQVFMDTINNCFEIESTISVRLRERLVDMVKQLPAHEQIFAGIANI